MTLIKREDAIDAIQTVYCTSCKERGDDYNEIRCRACEFDDAMIQIDSVPSAEAEWIPCSERLPLVTDQEVLATTIWGDVTIANRCTCDDWFIHEGNSNAKTSDIIAWMPLPKPYREDGEA